MAPDPRLIAAIRQQPAHLRIPLLTTALIESGGRLDAVGDGGRSHGPFQMYDLGRGAGVPIERRRDPVFSTQAAAREFQTFYDRGARGADLAFRAQRPADRGHYISRYQQFLPQAQRLLGQAGAEVSADPGAPRPAGRRTGTGAQTGGGGALTPGSLAAIRRYAAESEQDVMSGRMPGDVQTVLSQLRFAPKAAPRTPGGGGGHQPGDGHDHSGLTTTPGDYAGGNAQVAALLPGTPQWGSYGYGDPEGQGGKHLAVDWFGEHGVGARAPATGRVVRLDHHQSGNRTLSGQVYGGVLAIRDTAGRLHVMRHIDPRANLRVGMQLNAGDPIGTPTRWSGSDHIHYETYRQGSSDREYGAQYAINPRDVLASIFRRR